MKGEGLFTEVFEDWCPNARKPGTFSAPECKVSCKICGGDGIVKMRRYYKEISKREYDRLQKSSR